MPVPPGVLGKKLWRLGEALPRSLKLTSWIRLLKPVMTLREAGRGCGWLQEQGSGRRVNTKHSWQCNHKRSNSNTVPGNHETPDLTRG